MIITKLTGGLGNQLFQYALGRHIAYIHNTDLKLDVSIYENDPKRHYSLLPFNIKSIIAQTDEISNLNIVKEKAFSFDENILKTPNDSYLDGYWQSEKYFKDILETIKKEISLKDKFSDKIEKIAENIKNTSSISIHIRRGDYIKEAKTNAFHGTCSNEYYIKGVKKISESIENPTIFVFSDDIKWCQDNLSFSYPTIFINENNSIKDYEEIILMSLCKHNIIANSSFSWWGAWLNNNPKKIVIAPKRWFANDKIDSSDIIPLSWIKM